MQTFERSDTALAGFANDFARSVRIELIDHDAIVAEQRPNLARTFAIERSKIRRLVQSSHHRADGAGDILRRFVAGLSFDDDVSAGYVEGNVEAPVLDKLARKEPLYGIGSAQQTDPVAKVMQRARRQEFRQRVTDHVGHSAANEIRNVLGCPSNDPIRRHREKKADRLNGPQDVDRLAVAIREIDLNIRAGQEIARVCAR